MRSQGAQQMRYRSRRERVFVRGEDDCEKTCDTGIPQKWVDSGSVSKWRDEERLGQLCEALASACAHIKEDERALIDRLVLDEVPIAVVATESGRTRAAMDLKLFRVRSKLRRFLAVAGSKGRRRKVGGVHIQKSLNGTLS